MKYKFNTKKEETQIYKRKKEKYIIDLGF